MSAVATSPRPTEPRRHTRSVPPPAAAHARIRVLGGVRPRFAPPRPGQQGWSRRFAITATLVVVGGTLVAAGYTLGADHDPETPRRQGVGARLSDGRALTTYADAIHDLGERGGQVVQMGLKAGVDDIFESRYDDETLEKMTRAWVTSLEGIAGELGGLEAPAVLADAHSLYVAALDGYVTTARTLRAAAAAHGDLRRDLAELAAETGEAADGIWDRADESVTRERNRLTGDSRRGEERP